MSDLISHGLGETTLKFDFEDTLDAIQKRMESVGTDAGKILSQAYQEAVDVYSIKMKQSTIKQRKEMADDATEQSKRRIEYLEQEYAKRKALLKDCSDAERQSLEEAARSFSTEITNTSNTLKQLKRDAANATASANRVEAAKNGDLSQFKTGKQVDKEISKQEKAEEKQQARAQKMQDLEAKRLEAQSEADEEVRKKKLANIDKEEENLVKQAKTADQWNETVDKLKDTLSVSNLSKVSDSLVEEAANLIDEYQMSVTTRLTGSGKDWDSTSNLITGNLSLSGFTSSKAVLQNLNKLVENGIAYNVEQRAFLETMKESIATTFDTFNSSLTRIIKLQAADSTLARMGMESALNGILNNWYGDTSYLNSLSDTVSANLFEASSLLTKAESVQFEYAVQKWLGAMSSSGVSDATISSISQALGQLGSGDVSSLSGSTMQNLIVESLVKSGSSKSYSDLLTEGLDASNVNILLESMVKYLAEIADQTAENNVVRNAYANVFGVSVSDLQAIANVSSKLDEISGSLYSYSDLEGIASNQLATTTDRMSITKRMNNILSNLKLSAGMNIANSEVLYPMYEIINLVEGITGGTTIPTVSIMGNNLSFEGATIEGLLKTALMAGSTVSSLIDGFSSGNALGGINLSSFNGTDTWGGGTLSFATGSGKSASETIYNANSTDTTEQTLENAADSDATNESKKLSDKVKKSNKDKTTTDIFNALTDGDKENLLGLTQKSTTAIEGYVKQLTESTPVSLSTDLTSIKSDLKLLVDSITNLTTESDTSKVLSVNIKQLGSQPVTLENGLPIQFKTYNEEQLSNAVQIMAYKMGLGKEDARKGETVYTLQDLIDMLIAVKSENGDSLNINLDSVSSDVNMTTFLSHEKYFGDYNAKVL